MKKLLLILCLLIGCRICAQNLQFLYDLRGTLDPGHYKRNMPSLYFEYFKEQDSGKGVIRPGSFLFKTQADLTGGNINNLFLQVSQTLRAWKPKVFLHLQYSAGLGLTEPRQYSYYIRHAFGAGASVPFRLWKAYFTAIADWRYLSYAKPSHDLMLTLYWWRGLLNYRAEFSGDFSFWTENKNHGDALTAGVRGKRLCFFAEPQAWYRLAGPFSLGIKLNMFYHVLSAEPRLQLYPSLALRYRP
jgi:hypothetical protein